MRLRQAIKILKRGGVPWKSARRAVLTEARHAPSGISARYYRLIKRGYDLWDATAPKSTFCSWDDLR